MMIVFYIRDGRKVRKAVAVLPAIGRIVPGHGEVWKLDRDEHGNVQAHCK